jgi:hypothetical protein
VNAKLRDKLLQRKRRLQKRIDKKTVPAAPAIQTPSINVQLADRTQAIAAGGLCAIMQMIKSLDLRKTINQSIPIFKMYAPYDEADHVFNIALNLLSGGTCLDHLEIRRTDEAYLNALGAQRIPDPTTAGDFCRRFDEIKTLMLLQAFNQTRVHLWKQQPQAFLQRAIIEADGTMVETSGQRKEGIGMNYKKQWGYHPLVVTLANTQEVLYVHNRSGNRPSHEYSGFYFDRSIEVCRAAGFKEIVLRGDTDFSLTENFDRWDDDSVKFVFGYDAKPKLVAIAEMLETDAWKPLKRKLGDPPKTAQRAKRPNYKQGVIEEKEYLDKRLVGEWIAEFDYQPGNCNRSYRMVAVRKQIETSQGGERLFEEYAYFFYITNEMKATCSSRQVVFQANDRCDQENTISQLHACGALAAPLDNLVSNGAYMAIASLAWTLKCWSGLMIRPAGTAKQQEQQRELKTRVIRMEFRTFLQTIIQVPAQIIRTSRQLIYRLLTFRSSVEMLLTLFEHASRPLRC